MSKKIFEHVEVNNIIVDVVKDEHGNEIHCFEDILLDYSIKTIWKSKNRRLLHLKKRG